MRLLCIHADKMEYKTQKKTPVAEDIPEEKKTGSATETLVAFTAVELSDTKNITAASKKAATEILKIAHNVKCEHITLYPYAHLSPSLAKPIDALAALDIIEAELIDAGMLVLRSPFGWYKSFTLACKGHPLSELSREISSDDLELEEELSVALKAEDTMKSEWLIMDLDGKLHQLDIENNNVTGYEFKGNKNLKAFAQYEMAKSRADKGEPPHISLMQRLELVDYEPGSDPGHFRYYPKGKLVKNLLERYVNQEVKTYGGMEIESPIMYDYDHPSLKSYLNRFPARQYTIDTPDKKVFLRFAACFGQFLMLHDATLSYKHLPLKLYEMAKYSFRVEQRGELAGLRRLRAFTMPDCHAFCADLDMARSEVVERFDLSKKILTGLGLDIPNETEFALRVTQDFYDDNEEFLKSLVQRYGRPALMERWKDRFFYFVFKYEWNFVDASGKASALNTDQIDVENAERYGITYVGADGKDKHPYILHSSPSGAIERVMFALLEKAHMDGQKGTKPSLPFWLSPTQLRLIPVRDEFISDCEALADQLPGRVDIDDRDQGVGRRIRDSEREWIPLTIVYGEKEKESQKFKIRVRGKDERDFDHVSLKEYIHAGNEGYPFEPLALPRMLSIRPIFRG